MKTIGIIGGFGPESTAEFYISIVNKNRESGRCHPNIIIHNVPVPFYLERDMIRDGKDLEKYLPLLLESLDFMRDKADILALPCNTLHVFIDELRKASSVPVLSIIDETAKEIASKRLKKVGLLATTKTIESGLLELKLRSIGIATIRPDRKSQLKISEIIFSILTGEQIAKKDLLDMIRKLELQGAEAVVLGCTDLQLILKQNTCTLPLIDTMEILASSVIREAYGG